MKIVLPVHHFPPRYNAGAELYTQRLARLLQRRGHAVEVVCVEWIDRGEPGELSAAPGRYEGIPIWRLAFNLLGAAEQARWRYDNPLLGDWFKRYLEQAQPDIIHFQAGYLIGLAPLEAALAIGVPSVLTLHDYWFLCPRITLLRGDGSLCETIPADPAGCAWCMRLESRRYRIPNRLSGGMLGQVAQRLALNGDRDVIEDRRARLLPALNKVNAVIAPSQFLADRFAPFVAAGRLHHLPYGLDLTRFARRPSIAAPDGALRIGFIGQIAPHKGIHLLIQAVQRLAPRGRPIELNVYGGLEAQPRYVARLRRMAGNDRRIRLHGRIENSRVPEVLAGLDVSVTPSIWYENSPLAIHEAHAAGVPVITAALGGMAELVRDGVDGLHFRPNDASDLAQKLQQLIDRPDMLPRLRAGIKAPISIDDEMEELTELYRQLIARRSSASEAASSRP